MKREVRKVVEVGDWSKARGSCQVSQQEESSGAEAAASFSWG